MAVIFLAFAFGGEFAEGGKSFALLYRFAWWCSSLRQKKSESMKKEFLFKLLWPLRGFFPSFFMF